MSYVDKVFKVVKKIPKGFVATYGQVAKIVGVDPRMVGWALHSNKDKKVPCHRVVNKDGRLAPNFAFDGWREQKKRLEAEGVKFINEVHVGKNYIHTLVCGCNGSKSLILSMAGKFEKFYKKKKIKLDKVRNYIDYSAA